MCILLKLNYVTFGVSNLLFQKLSKKTVGSARPPLVVVVVVVDSHKVWGNKWCTQGSRKCSAGQVMAQPNGMVIGFVRPDWFGVFPTALVQLFSCGRTTSPQHNFASHYITIYTL